MFLYVDNFFVVVALFTFFQQDQGIYQSKVRQMISENKSRLIVNLNDIRRRNEQRAAKYVTLYSSVHVRVATFSQAK